MIQAATALLLLALGNQPQLPPDAPETALLARCMICHGNDYVLQQRLTKPQWEKTLLKMQKWGAPLNAAELESLVGFLSARFTPEAPEVEPKRVPTPAAALPSK
jgi:hypothetical protein